MGIITAIKEIERLREIVDVLFAQLVCVIYKKYGVIDDDAAQHHKPDENSHPDGFSCRV